MAKKKTQPMEIVEVDVKTEEAIKPVEGRPFPTKLTNPTIGEPGHHCLDPQGRYQPSWFTVYIHRTTETASRQAFISDTGTILRVETGRWVDVPPSVVAGLGQAKYDDIKQSISEENGLMAKTEYTAQSTPRFQYSTIPSA